MAENLSDVGAERAVLAGLLQHGLDGYVSVADIISTESFSNSNNQVIFRCIKHILDNDQSIDIASLLSAAQHLNFIDLINTKQELAYINALFEFPINQDNIYHFAIQVKKFEFAKKIRSLTTKIHKDVGEITGEESVNDIINILEDPVTDFLREDDGGDHPEKIGSEIQEYLQYLEENKCDIIGIPT